MRPLNGRTALVTGAGRRIGRAIAMGLARAGMNIVAHYRRSQEPARQLVGEMCAQGARGWALAADLADPVQVETLLPRAAELAGEIDVLVNNASTFPLSKLLAFSSAELQAEVQVNAMAPLALARAFSAQCRAGDVINLLDARIVHDDPEHTAYLLSKRMLRDLTGMLAVELAPGIRVNAVAPGLVLPPAGKDEGYLEQLAGSNPLHRVGALDELVETVCFLLRSEFITGQIIFFDGGQHLTGNTHV